MRFKKYTYALLVSIIVATSTVANAHFPWLVRQSDGRIAFYFGEGLADQTYKLPNSMADAKVLHLTSSGKLEPVAVKAVEQPAFVGLQSEQPVAADATFISRVVFGVYHGSRLEYYTMHKAGTLPSQRGQVSKALSAEMDLLCELIRNSSRIEAFVSWKGQPLKDIVVHLYNSKGEEKAKAETDSQGRVQFSPQQLGDGQNALMFGHKLSEAGKLADKPFESQSHYMTVTFENQSQPQANATSSIKPASAPLAVDRSKTSSVCTASTVTTKIPALPIEVTSFGAVRHGESIYLYGGHTGSAHSYSNDAQNDKLLKLDLQQIELGWQAVTTGDRLQGLGMVAYGEKLIVIGGFTAMNTEGQQHDLRSQAAVKVFDLTSGQWQELPELPEPRSSHDAALIGDTIFVVGGWNMQGQDNTHWHSTAWALNLSFTKPKWIEIKQPPFVRRAVAVVAHEGKLFVIGGMNEQGGPTRDVAVYDPASNNWSVVGPLLGEKSMAGFGAAACSLDGLLVTTTMEGSVQHWDPVTRSWAQIGNSRDARFFHRLLPVADHKLIAIGGANMEQGKFSEVEALQIAKHPETEF